MVRELQYMRAEVAFLKKLKELEERERQVKLKVSACQHQFRFDPLLGLFNNLELTHLAVLK